MRVYAPLAPSSGYAPIGFARNEAVVDAGSLARLASIANMFTGNRGKVLLTKSVPFASAIIGVGTSQDYGRFYTSDHPTSVEIITILYRTNSSTAASGYQWTVGGNVQPARSVFGNATAATGPSDVTVDRQIFRDASLNPLAGATAYDIFCATSTNLQVLGFVIYETQNSVISTTNGAIDPSFAKVGNPATGADLTALTNAFWGIYKNSGGVPIYWSAGDTASTRIGATYANILGGATTGYAATAPGFWTFPYRRATMTGTTVNCTFWASATVNVGTGGRVRFSNSAGVLATITGFNTAINTLTTTGTMDSSLTSDLVIIEHSDSAGNTITTYGAGCYERET